MKAVTSAEVLVSGISKSKGTPSYFIRKEVNRVGYDSTVVLDQGQFCLLGDKLAGSGDIFHRHNLERGGYGYLVPRDRGCY